MCYTWVDYTMIETSYIGGGVMEYQRADNYYNFSDDLEKFPDCWCYIVWSARGVGKTYGALWYAYCKHIPIVYMKRTKGDVNLICNENKIGFDASPYVPINRDHQTEIHARRIQDGIGGFYEGDLEAGGLPLSYVLALSAAKSYKGFDFSRCEWLVFDEFIPQIGEIIRRGEGEMLLDLYMTIRRDREQRGRAPLKLVLFANAEDISTPTTNVLEVVDIMADMNANGEEYRSERGIMLHHVRAQAPEDENKGIYAAMAGTAWARKAFGGEFANNDFSCVRSCSIKGMRPIIKLQHKGKEYYIYQRFSDSLFYMCSIRGTCSLSYNLDREIEAKRFWLEQGIFLVSQCIDGRMLFQKYSMYDLIMNYRKFFDV